MSLHLELNPPGSCHEAQLRAQFAKIARAIFLRKLSSTALKTSQFWEVFFLFNWIFVFWKSPPTGSAMKPRYRGQFSKTAADFST